MSCVLDICIVDFIHSFFIYSKFIHWMLNFCSLHFSFIHNKHRHISQQFLIRHSFILCHYTHCSNTICKLTHSITIHPISSYQTINKPSWWKVLSVLKNLLLIQIQTISSNHHHVSMRYFHFKTVYNLPWQLLSHVIIFLFVVCFAPFYQMLVIHHNTHTVYTLIT